MAHVADVLTWDHQGDLRDVMKHVLPLPFVNQLGERLKDVLR